MCCLCLKLSFEEYPACFGFVECADSQRTYELCISHLQMCENILNGLVLGNAREHKSISGFAAIFTHDLPKLGAANFFHDNATLI